MNLQSNEGSRARSKTAIAERPDFIDKFHDA